jgi:hypothetical protein
MVRIERSGLMELRETEIMRDESLNSQEASTVAGGGTMYLWATTW